jgi:hypothetical protein
MQSAVVSLVNGIADPGFDAGKPALRLQQMKVRVASIGKSGNLVSWVMGIYI